MYVTWTTEGDESLAHCSQGKYNLDGLGREKE
jgi:hypothetical protein